MADVKHEHCPPSRSYCTYFYLWQQSILSTSSQTKHQTSFQSTSFPQRTCAPRHRCLPAAQIGTASAQLGPPQLRPDQLMSAHLSSVPGQLRSALSPDGVTVSRVAVWMLPASLVAKHWYTPAVPRYQTEDPQPLAAVHQLTRQSNTHGRPRHSQYTYSTGTLRRPAVPDRGSSAAGRRPSADQTE